jgi:hypothetical protein
MSERLVKHWTPDNEGAYGAKGKRGDEGETFVTGVINSWVGWECVNYRSDKSFQRAGIDIVFKKDTWKRSFSADVKNNISPSGSFCVEIDAKGWLFNPNKISNRIWHVNPDTGAMAWYDRKDMQAFISNTELRSFFKDGKLLVEIAPEMGGNFITRRKVR